MHSNVFFFNKYLLIAHCAKGREHDEKSGLRPHADGVRIVSAMKIEF